MKEPAVSSLPEVTRSGSGSALKHVLTSTRAGRIALVAPRAALALRASGLGRQLWQIAAWSVTSRETANFTYETTRHSDLLLAGVVAEIAGRPVRDIVAYLDELNADRELAAHVAAMASRPEQRWRLDPGFRPGRRIAFYLLARALKPARIVEAGVDKGLGAVLLCRALQLNVAEGGAAGDYVGIERDPAKPIELYETYAHRSGRIARGDSVSIIRAMAGPIDLFIHDTIPEPRHTATQLEAVTSRLAPGGVIASTWTTPELVEHALRHDLRLLTHQEETAGHWFPGDRVGFAYAPRRR